MAIVVATLFAIDPLSVHGNLTGPPGGPISLLFMQACQPGVVKNLEIEVHSHNYVVRPKSCY